VEFRLCLPIAKSPLVLRGLLVGYQSFCRSTPDFYFAFSIDKAADLRALN
jgi:hypothetical protein